MLSGFSESRNNDKNTLKSIIFKFLAQSLLPYRHDNPQNLGHHNEIISRLLYIFELGPYSEA